MLGSSQPVKLDPDAYSFHPLDALLFHSNRIHLRLDPLPLVPHIAAMAGRQDVPAAVSLELDVCSVGGWLVAPPALARRRPWSP